MYQSNLGLEDVIANSLAGLSFSGFTLLMLLVVAGFVWCAVPFALLSMRRRLFALERVVEETSSMTSAEIRRITDILLLERMRGGEIAKPAQDSAESAGDNTVPFPGSAPVRFFAPRGKSA